MRLLIVHLSDLHLRVKGNPVVAKFPFITKALQNEEVALDGVVVVVSGDIAFSGKLGEYTVATECLQGLQKELADKTKVGDTRFVFVPGNHHLGQQRIAQQHDGQQQPVLQGLQPVARQDNGTGQLSHAPQELRVTPGRSGFISSGFFGLEQRY